MMKLLDKREFNLNLPPALLLAKIDVLTVADHRLFKMLKSVSDSDVKLITISSEEAYACAV